LDASFKVTDERPVEARSFFQFRLRYVEVFLSDRPNNLAKRLFHPRARLNLFSELDHLGEYRARLSVIGQGSVTDNSQSENTTETLRVSLLPLRWL